MILNCKVIGKGKPIVLLHGMAGSLRYWEAYIPLLSKTHKIIAIDLLGYGKSPQSYGGYTPQEHIQAMRDTLRSLGVHQPATLVGHSMGSLLALKYAVLYPEEVSKLVLLNMPVYTSPAEAKKDITQSKKVLEYAYYGNSSRALCTTWCRLLRPLTKHLAPLYLPTVPKAVAEDSLLHTWKSYSESMKHVIEDQTVEADLRKLTVPTIQVYGSQESPVVLRNVAAIKGLGHRIDTQIIAGSHKLPLEKPELISGLILS